MQIKSKLKLIVAIGICQAAGLVGSLYTADAIPTWYATLVKPDWQPPNWLFGPVWLTLYTLMGIALYLVWTGKAKNRDSALAIFAIQLVLNAVWSIIFFGQQNPQSAFVEILVLWLAIATSIWQFSKINKRAAWLLVPYILWVSFAAVLNYSIWQLNL